MLGCTVVHACTTGPGALGCACSSQLDWPTDRPTACLPALCLHSAPALQGRAQYIKLGDKEVEYNRAFRLVLHTKLSSPHYPPEVQVGAWLWAGG